jgi:hypothetical protein
MKTVYDGAHFPPAPPAPPALPPAPRPPAAANISSTCFEMEIPPEVSLFFDESCLTDPRVVLDPKVRSSFSCPVANVTAYMQLVGRGWRIESQCCSLIGFVITVMLMQAGGVPIPRNIIGKALWGVWMILQLCQLATMIFSVTMVIVAHYILQDLIAPCMVRFG